MGKEYKYNKQCKFCGKELTSETTSKNFINDQNYMCFNCASGRMSSGGYRIHNLERTYDPNKNKTHNEIHRKAQLHTNQIEIHEEKISKSVGLKEKIYPTPKGRSIIIRHMEIECPKCHTILTTTNAYPERVRSGRYICNQCMREDREEANTDPLYNDKKEIKSILHKLYARRRLKQFTWEYVKTRFVKMQESTVPQIDKEEYDKTINLFGEEYASKRFKPKTNNALQMSFGDLSSREGCKRLLSLFEYELYKSRHAGKRKKEKFETRQYLKMFDPEYNRQKDNNIGGNPDDYGIHDKYFEEAYTKTTYKPKLWDPYTQEVS